MESIRATAQETQYDDRFMKTFYNIVRIIAYIATLSGLGLLFWGRSAGGETGQMLQAASAACIAVGFGAFLVSYAIYMYYRFMK